MAGLGETRLFDLTEVLRARLPVLRELRFNTEQDESDEKQDTYRGAISGSGASDLQLGDYAFENEVDQVTSESVPTPPDLKASDSDSDVKIDPPKPDDISPS